MSDYSVLLGVPQDLQNLALVTVLAHFSHTVSADAIRVVKNSWGIVGEHLDEPKARQLADALQAAGIRNHLLQSESFVDPPPPAGVARLELRAERLDLVLRTQETVSLPWSEIVLLAAFGFESVTVKKVKTQEGPTTGQKMVNMGILMATGLPIRIGKAKKEVEKVLEHSEALFFIDLCQGHPLQRFRIQAEAFDYSCLHEKKMPSAQANYKTLVKELIQRAGKPLINGGAREILENRPISHAGYRSEADGERELRWLLTIKSLDAKGNDSH